MSKRVAAYVRNFVFSPPPLQSEQKATAANERRIAPCATGGCPSKGTLDSPWCAKHREKKPETIDSLDPKVDGLCNWPIRTRRRGRCRQLVGRCVAHRGEPPL